MHRRQTSYWAWKEDDWLEIFCPSTKAFRQRYPRTHGHNRHLLVASMYLLGVFDDFRKLGIIDRPALASRIFGRSRVTSALKRVIDLARSWGYSRFTAKDLHWGVCTMLLANKNPRLEKLTLDLLEAERKRTAIDYRRSSIGVLSRVLVGLKITPRSLAKNSVCPSLGDARNGVSAQWLQWVERWHSTSTLQDNSRKKHYLCLLKLGRWVTAVHPACVSPERWTREIAAEWVATVCRMKIGDWTQVNETRQKRRGQPLSAKAKAHHLASAAAFFRDIHEWGWIPRRFDPRRSFAAPRSLRALIGPKPRVIADDLWAKLLWAGLNLTQEDLSTSHDCPRHYYPLSMARALTIVWLFCGLRTDEIRRLPLGCTREHWNPEPALAGKVCHLAVPVNKTSQAFTKPVDSIVIEVVRQWEAERPTQPPSVDSKTGELVHFLFMYRCNQVSATYINDTLIPILCRKAGTPLEDALGKLTSHRARSTIASQLFTAKQPMSLFELQKWLGHKWANSTQHYLALSPTKLAQAYRDAGYFARNLRSVEVLIDRETVISGKAAKEPWRFYDLGHGYCTYDFFDQCPHRMACAKCNFYLPKDSSRAQLLEGKTNLLQVRQEIPLTEAEVAAVDDGVAAMEKLLEQLADVPTPAGPTPRELQVHTILRPEEG
ncbi:MAG TPA: tyrosine-type recombinase/integrase [Edaphobacter sp.]|nr:tyrosine-type recombinase/integrase [Edaphobacter sp.]